MRSSQHSPANSSRSVHLCIPLSLPEARSLGACRRVLGGAPGGGPVWWLGFPRLAAVGCRAHGSAAAQQAASCQGRLSCHRPVVSGVAADLPVMVPRPCWDVVTWVGRSVGSRPEVSGCTEVGVCQVLSALLHAASQVNPGEREQRGSQGKGAGTRGSGRRGGERGEGKEWAAGAAGRQAGCRAAAALPRPPAGGRKRPLRSGSSWPSSLSRAPPLSP